MRIRKLTKEQVKKIQLIQERIYKLDQKLGYEKKKFKEKENEIICKANSLYCKIDMIKRGVE